MKLKKIIDARGAIAEFSNGEKISASICYWAMKFMVKTDSDAEFFNNKIKEIIDKYTVVNEDGKQFIPSDKSDIIEEEIEEIGNTEAEDPGIKFPLSELSKGLNLSMKQMYSLIDFVDDSK